MTFLRNVSSEVIGLVFLALSAAATVAIPGIGEFWIALATAIMLFLLMYFRLNYKAAGGDGETS
jgi:hypothetical protein